MISEPIIFTPLQEKLYLRPSCCLAMELELKYQFYQVLPGSNYNHSQHVQQSHNTLVVGCSKQLKVIH